MKCPACGCFMKLSEPDCNGEIDIEYYCNNQNCKANIAYIESLTIPEKS